MRGKEWWIGNRCEYIIVGGEQCFESVQIYMPTFNVTSDLGEEILFAEKQDISILICFIIQTKHYTAAASNSLPNELDYFHLDLSLKEL